MTDHRHGATYLGDGLYAKYDGFQVRLFAHNGLATTNEVYLDPEVRAALIRFLEQPR